MPYKDPEVRKRKQAEYSRRWYENNKEKTIATTKRTKAETRRLWAEFKSNLQCVECGESHVATLDFHHVLPQKGNRKLHRLIADGRFNAAMEEIKKCVVLCANCHRKHHHKEKRGPKPP